MRLVIVGTGATSGTLGQSGGVAGFPRRLGEVRSNWRQAYAALANLVADCVLPGEDEASIGLDRIWTRIDYFSKLRHVLGSEYGGAAASELRRAVLDAYSFEHEIKSACAVPADFHLKAILGALMPGDTLISFNWDTLAESLALALGMDLVQAPHPSTPRGVRFVKPHGSLSWEHRAVAAAVEVIYRDNQKPRLLLTSPSQGQFGFVQPLLLGAVPIKSEILQEIQVHSGHDRVHEVITEQWREVLDAASQASTIVVAGYSFPVEDAYGRFIFAEAKRRRKSPVAPTVTYYARERCSEFEKTLTELFGPAKFVGAIGPAK